jgi:hypothetical protein
VECERISDAQSTASTASERLGNPMQQSLRRHSMG